MHLSGKPAAAALVAATFFVVALLGSPTASSQTVDRYVIGNGGMMIVDNAGQLVHGGTVGQTLVGLSQNPGSEFDVYHGFWYRSGLSTVDEAVTGASSALRNSPNPFTTSTTVHFTIPSRSEVRVRVYDMEGKLVRTLVDGTYSPGTHTAGWDALDSSGDEVASGYYYYTLDARPTDTGGRAVSAQQKMLLMK